MSATDGKLTWSTGDQAVKDYQNNNQISGQYRLYVRDDHGNPTAAKAWRMDLGHLNTLLADAQTRCVAMGKTLSGIRIYPALYNKDHQGNTVPDFHTLVIVGTYLDDNNIQQNVQLEYVMDYVDPCPKACPTLAKLGY